MDIKSQEDKDFEESLRRRKMIDEVFRELLDMATKNYSLIYFLELLLIESKVSEKSLIDVISETIKRSPAEVEVTAGFIMFYSTPNKEGELFEIADLFLDSLLRKLTVKKEGDKP